MSSDTRYAVVQKMSSEPRLAGKVAVISGASRGFGQAIAVRFVEEGARVALLSRGDCDETLALISSIAGLKEPVANVARWVKADIGTDADCAAAAAGVLAAFGPDVHILVNNAALFVFKSIEHATAEDWDASAGVNIRGHALLTKHLLPAMKGRRGASIVWQASISSFIAQPDCATYSAMKGAIVQMARNAAFDFAKYGIRSNSVCAGTIETPISAVERKEHGWTFDEWQALKVKDVIMGRVGTTREIANATLFFASEESSYCNATHLLVDGGQVGSSVGSPGAGVSY